MRGRGQGADAAPPVQALNKTQLAAVFSVNNATGAPAAVGESLQRSLVSNLGLAGAWRCVLRQASASQARARPAPLDAADAGPPAPAAGPTAAAAPGAPAARVPVAPSAAPPAGAPLAQRAAPPVGPASGGAAGRAPPAGGPGARAPPAAPAGTPPARRLMAAPVLAPALAPDAAAAGAPVVNTSLIVLTMTLVDETVTAGVRAAMHALILTWAARSLHPVACPSFMRRGACPARRSCSAADSPSIPCQVIVKPCRARAQAKIILNSTALLLAALGDLNSDLPAPVNAVRLLYVTGQAALPLAPAPAPAPTVAVPSPSSSGAGALRPRRAQLRSEALGSASLRSPLAGAGRQAASRYE